MEFTKEEIRALRERKSKLHLRVLDLLKKDVVCKEEQILIWEYQALTKIFKSSMGINATDKKCQE
ncbi:unnamed protein product [marine sediment metagenome]|uniref:Uncharacterized protein n=1 Tax=marine sediment metagenome TaxID=412755 RepID=X0WSJ7_9ZZZZ